MPELPVYLWLITLAGVTGTAATTCVVLYQGAIRAGQSRRHASLLAVVAAVLLGGWLAASAVFAASGGYRVDPGGRQIPWLPTAVVIFTGGQLALTLVPSVRRAVKAPGTIHSLMHPHRFRIVGVVFLAAMFLGDLPVPFALPAGVGDIAVSIAAPFIARKLARGEGRRGALWFNALGIADLVVALTLGALTAYRIIPGSVSAQAINVLPLALIPTVAVPILLALHITSLLFLTRRPQASTREQSTSLGATKV